MSEGLHVYKKTSNGRVKLCKSVNTVAQARSAGAGHCISVTSKLGIAPNPFMEDWSRRAIFDIAKKNPNASYEEANKLRWGQREDVDGKLISSSEFGNRVHKELENSLAETKMGLDPVEGPYWKWCREFLEWFKLNCFTVEEVEFAILCERRRLAGMIDVIARDKEGQVVLMDFKTRACKGGDPKTRTYPKDAQQLAIEALMIAEQWKLDYVPRIYSVIIDTTTGETGIKLWTEYMQEKECGRAEAINEFYNKYEGL